MGGHRPSRSRCRWFTYLHNDFYDKHEADWEGVTVVLHGTNPLGVSYSAHQRLGGAPYTGDWGSGNYILGIGRTSDHVTDPRRRSEYTDPFAILTR